MEPKALINYTQCRTGTREICRNRSTPVTRSRDIMKYIHILQKTCLRERKEIPRLNTLSPRTPLTRENREVTTTTPLVHTALLPSFSTRCLHSAPAAFILHSSLPYPCVVLLYRFNKIYTGPLGGPNLWRGGML